MFVCLVEIVNVGVKVIELLKGRVQNGASWYFHLKLMIISANDKGSI